MSIKINRRKLFGYIGATAALGLMAKRDLLDAYAKRTFSGKVLGANFKRGHRLLKMNFPAPTERHKVNVAIVGTGISGLSCAYHLKKAGINDIELFDLEDHLGGKSASFNKEAPWGAHYLPLPNPENRSLINFLKEIKVITKEDHKGLNYDELFVCSDPMEKLYIYGRLQEGLIPQEGLDQKERLEFKKFFQLMEQYKGTKGEDRKFAFDIPIAMSSSDPNYLKYDKITMEDYLLQNDLVTKPLHWYVNYCCRDDYGTTIKEISAWAGMHYFCSRRGKGINLKDESVLTWPEGNNYLANKLHEESNSPLNTDHMLYEVRDNSLLFFNHKKNITTEVIANHIVLALPQFIIGRILKVPSTFEYSPWMVANIKIKWDERLAEALAWDNVNYHGRGLGFVVAGHQSLRRSMEENILTYYWPLTHLPPKKARNWALGRSHESWSKDILKDLTPMIFDIEDRIKSIDIWPWGHGMVRPTKGFLFGERNNVVPKPHSNIHYAHTDLSGLSLFEEGFYQGETTSKNIIKSLNGVKG